MTLALYSRARYICVNGIVSRRFIVSTWTALSPLCGNCLLSAWICERHLRFLICKLIEYTYVNILSQIAQRNAAGCIISQRKTVSYWCSFGACLRLSAGDNAVHANISCPRIQSQGHSWGIPLLNWWRTTYWHRFYYG